MLEVDDAATLQELRRHAFDQGDADGTRVDHIDVSVTVCEPLFALKRTVSLHRPEDEQLTPIGQDVLAKAVAIDPGVVRGEPALHGFVDIILAHCNTQVAYEILARLQYSRSRTCLLEETIRPSLHDSGHCINHPHSSPVFHHLAE